MNQSFNKSNGGVQNNPKAYMTSLSESNGSYMNEIGSEQRASYGNFSSLPENLPQSSLVDPSWFVDFGATNRITSQLNNLSLHAPYNGANKVIVGNGKNLPISNIGISHVYTQTYPKSVLSLPNILHVPSITKNLLSVSQFIRDHNVVAEFYAHSCLIKNKSSGQVLLRGQLKDGLYQWIPAFAHVASSLSVHPIKQLVKPFSSRPDLYLNQNNRQHLSLNTCNKPSSFGHGLLVLM